MAATSRVRAQVRVVVETDVILLIDGHERVSDMLDRARCTAANAVRQALEAAKIEHDACRSCAVRADLRIGGANAPLSFEAAAKETE